MLLNCEYSMWGGAKVSAVSLEDVNYMVNPPENHEFYVKTKESIMESGMRDPVCLVEVSPERLEVLQRFAEDPFLLVQDYSYNKNGNVLMAVAGNNRILIASELGYKSIDAVVMDVDDFVAVARVRNKNQKEPESNRERYNG